MPFCQNTKMPNFALATLNIDGKHESALLMNGEYHALKSIKPLPDTLNSSKSVAGMLHTWDLTFPVLCSLADDIAAGRVQSKAETMVRLQTPVMYPNKLLAVGANYAGHLKELEWEPRKVVPMPFFLRPPTTSLVGPGKTVRKPRTTEQFDWELELVVVMGRSLRHATSKAEASAAIAGFTIGLDLSCRDVQFTSGTKSMDLVRGKAQDTLAPCGPTLLPKQFLDRDVADLHLLLSVNGEKRVDARTSEMLYNIEEQLIEISQIMTLEPGDMIFTGAPAGSAKAHGDRWLRVGDQIRAEIEAIGVLEVEIADDN